MKRMIGLFLALAMLTVGCAAVKNDGTAQGNETGAAQSAGAAQTLTGRIEAIDDNGLTLSVMPSRPEGGQPANGQGTPPDMSSGGQGTPPDMPSGGQGTPPDMPSDGQGGTFPGMPSDGQGGFTPPDMPSNGQGMPQGESKELVFADDAMFLDENGGAIERSALNTGDMVTVTLDENSVVLTVQKAAMNSGMPEANGQGGPNGAPGGSAPSEYAAVSTYAEDASISGEQIVSTGTDENAILVQNGATVSVMDCAVTRTSSDSTGGDSASFYGVGAALLVTDGTLNVENATITTDAAGGTGVFAYGSGVANVKNTVIKTAQGTSGGLHVAGGGTLHAENCTVETDGGSAAAIRSDRGGGTMTVDGGSYTSNGVGSPAIYCTADITVSNATLTATGSEAVCIEGKNSLALTDCTLTGDMPENAQNDCTWTVILYQSMSGDSEIGTSHFSMTGGTLTSKNGGMFYTTNTASEFRLENVALVYADDCEFLFKCTGNSNARGWGQSGSNGAQSTLTAVNQAMENDIVWDSISTLAVSLENGSTWTGAFVQDETNAGGGGTGTASLSIDETSTWIVTGDSFLTTLTNHGTIVDETGNTVTIRTESGETLVQGTGAYVVTVSTYAA